MRMIVDANAYTIQVRRIWRHANCEFTDVAPNVVLTGDRLRASGAAKVRTASIWALGCIIAFVVISQSASVNVFAGTVETENGVPRSLENIYVSDLPPYINRGLLSQNSVEMGLGKRGLQRWELFDGLTWGKWRFGWVGGVFKIKRGGEWVGIDANIRTADNFIGWSLPEVFYVNLGGRKLFFMESYWAVMSSENISAKLLLGRLFSASGQDLSNSPEPSRIKHQPQGECGQESRGHGDDPIIRRFFLGVFALCGFGISYSSAWRSTWSWWI